VFKKKLCKEDKEFITTLKLSCHLHLEIFLFDLIIKTLSAENLQRSLY